MPEAKAAYAAPTAQIKRVLFAHFHENQTAFTFPAELSSGAETALAILKIPTDWDGISKITVIWIAGNTDAAFGVDFQIDAGTDGEAPNTHTQVTVANTENVVANVYEFTEIEVLLGTVVAAILPDDVLRIYIINNDVDWMLYAYGVEIEEA